MSHVRAHPLFAALLLAVAAPAQAKTFAELWQQLEQMPAQAATSKGATVEVLDVDGKPAPSAVLAVITWKRVDGSSEEKYRRLYGIDDRRSYAALALAFGTRCALDAQGRTRLDANEHDPIAAIVAFSKDAVALALPGTDLEARPLQLRLRVRRTFHVAVTTSDGKPAAGVSVGMGVGGRVGACVVPTSGDGTAILCEPMSDESYRDLCVGVQLATEKPLVQALPASAMETVRFQLPVCGSVRVLLVHADPKTARKMRFVLGVTDHPRLTVSTTSSDEQGGVFAFVEPGGKFAVNAFIGDGGSPMVVPVPLVEAGKETLVTVDLAMGPPQLSFRVLDPSGKPMANARIGITWEKAGQSSGTNLETDIAGQADLTADEGYTADGKLWVEWCRSGDSSTPVESYAEVPIASLVHGRNELGDVRLQAAPVLVSGKVVDRNGQPIAGIMVAASPVRGVNSEPSAADGSFNIVHRPPLPTTVNVSVNSSDTFLADNPGGVVTCAAGTTDLRLVIARAARLLVHVAPVPEGALSLFEVECPRTDSDAEPYYTTVQAITKQLVMPPGKWNFVFRFSNQGDEVFHIDGVCADEGVECHDARLMNFDWQKVASLVTVTVLGPDGNPYDDCTVWRYVPYRIGRGRDGVGVCPLRGVASLLVPKDGGLIAVQPRSKSLRPVDLGLVKGEQRVQLKEWPKLRLQFSPMPKLPPDCTLWFGMDDIKATPGVSPGDGEMDGKGLTQFSVVTPGSHSLYLHALKRQGTGRSSMRLGEAPLVLEVTEDDLEHRIDLTPALQAAIDEACTRF